MLLTGADYPTLVHVLRRRALVHPEKVAFAYAHSSTREETKLTYGSLDRRARVVAARLLAEGCGNEPVVLLYQPGLEFITAFLGCLYAGATAVPAYPPAGARGQGLSKLLAILKDCGARIVLTHAEVSENVPSWRETAPELSSLRWIATEDLQQGDCPPFDRMPKLDGDRPAFLQYTSGSTASPRGALVTHGNVIHNLECVRHAFAGDEEADHGVFWLPQYHDMGLTGGLLLTCWAGSRSTILSPLAFVKRPLTWLQTITRTGATISGGPNFAYDLCVQRISDSDLADLDLSSWRIAFSGAETVQARTCHEFARRFEQCGFRRDAFQPGYGLAEATLIVSSRPPASPLLSLDLDGSALENGRARLADANGQARVRTVVSCGPPVPGQEVRIVDPRSCRELPPLEVGEIWVRSASIAKGYWGRPEESETTFGGLLDSGAGPFLRTGDLGFLSEGELFVTGRMKELLVFNGKNHYPLDIERTVHDADLDLSLCAAVSAPLGPEEKLVLVCQTRTRRDLENRALAISQAVAREHGVSVHDVAFVGPGGIPRTSSGKIQRRAVAARYAAGELSRLDSPERSDSVSSLVALLTSEIAAKAGVPASSIDIQAPFVSFGLGSVDAVRITGRLEEHLGRSLSPTLAYEYPTIDALARYLANGEERARSDVRGPAVPDAADGIAIVGMACRFPGASDLAAFEALLRRGADAVGSMPPGRTTYGDGGPGPVAGYLEEVDRFAAETFGIDSAEAAAMDPQQRLVLELAFSALEDAGHPASTLKGSDTGVWVGISSADYALERFGDRHAHPHSHAAQAHSIAANRISYQFDLQGPSISVDTACSSSLVALHLACQAMRAGDCRLALVGGVNVLLARSITEQFARGGYMSKSGRCRAFDAGADGYVRGEGAAVVVLKPLARALTDRDRIYAVVRATAVNQDGRTNGLTAPSRQAQEALLRRAYAGAAVDPRTVTTIEAHGTGTPLGDPIEARALGAVVGRERAANPCRIGSVKSNIGHLEAGAGIAGLVKTALSLYTRTLYPSCHFKAPNPNVDLEALGLRVQIVCEPWPSGAEPIAGVSSFGFGGTNAHAVLSAPALPAKDASEARERAGAYALLPVSAPSAPELRTFANALAHALDSETPRLNDTCFTVAARRTHHRHRLAVLGRTSGELAHRLRARAAEVPPAPTGARRERIAFAFGGQGGQWLAMGRDLLSQQPVFRAAFEQVAAAVEREAAWSLVESLADPGQYSRIDRVQPMLFALGVASSQLLRSWGIEPDFMIGQSMGEITAATAAGALTVEDGARAMVRRSALLARLSGSGSMAMVDLPASLAASRVQRHGVTVAVHASPTTSVIAGDESAVRAACSELEGDGVGVRAVKVDVASHCRLVEPLREPLLRDLGSLRCRRGNVPILSSVTGRPLLGDEIDAGYLWRNLREPVRFAETIDAAVASGVRWFVEIGPHPVLSASIAQCLSSGGVGALGDCLVLPTLQRDRDGSESLLETVAVLYERGCDLDWAAIHSGSVVDLPQPCLPRRRHWTEPPTRRSSARETSHPLLDGEVQSAALEGTRVFELALSAAAFPELAEHRIAGVPVLSAGAFLELAQAAIGETLGCESPVALEDVKFERLLQVPAAASRAVQVVVSQGRFTIESKASGPGWTRHVSGAYRVADEDEGISMPAVSPQARSIPTAELYSALESGGLTYGASCQRLAEARLDGDTCEVRLDTHQDLRDDRYFLHPHVLDMCLQAVGPLADRPALLQRVRELRFRRRAEGAVAALARREAGSSFQILFSDSRGMFATISGLELTSPDTRPLREPEVWRKRLEWSRAEAPVPATLSGRWAVAAPPGPFRDALEKAAPRATGTEELAGVVFVAAPETRVVDLVQLAQSAGGVPVWLVTRGAFGVLADDARDPMHAALSAAARAAWAEGVLDGAAIDLEKGSGASVASAEDEADLVWREIKARGRHSLAAFRSALRYVPRLTPVSQSASGSSVEVDARSTYLVTGGSSDLGLHAAEWLVRRGARHLVLCGRSESVVRSERVAALESLGASVRYRRLDVADPAAVAALAAELACGPEVAGIVHAAGVADLCPFSELDEERIAGAFRPKVAGAENLKNHFAGPRLKFFLLYASSSVWLGALARGLAHYAAANAYLEAFAAELARRGTNAVAIAWPPWHGIGRVREAAASGHFEALGVSTLAPEEANEILNRLDRPTTLLGAIDRSRYSCRGADAGLLADLDDGSAGAAGPAAAPYEAPRDLLEERLAASWREVLGVERVGRRDSFFSLGGSSIKAATLLNRLRKHMTEPISIVALFEAPTVAHLASYLREHHPDCASAIESASLADGTKRAIERTDRPLELLARIHELSDEQVDALLLEHGSADAR
jgi:acyl transferase domain-containing protein/acyl-CoA synthetase (AMP-forming)/AMP-acid ligase II/acyl carrier protein